MNTEQINNVPDNLADAQEFVSFDNEQGKAPSPACKCGGCTGGCASCKCGGGNCQKCKVEEDLETGTI